MFAHMYRSPRQLFSNRQALSFLLLLILLAAHTLFSPNLTYAATKAITITITRQPAAPTYAPAVVFEFTSKYVDYSYPTVERSLCSIDSKPFALCVSPVRFSGLKPGSHSFIVQTEGQTNAQTYTWTQNALAGSYLIQNSQTRQPLAVPYVASPQGQQLTTQSAPGYLEEWLIRSDGALANAATGMLANVYGNSTAPNTPAIAWQDLNPLPSNMRWRFVDEGSGQYSIVSALNGYVLDVDPNNMANVRLNPREVPSPGQTTSYKWWTLDFHSSANQTSTAPKAITIAITRQPAATTYAPGVVFEFTSKYVEYFYPTVEPSVCSIDSNPFVTCVSPVRFSGLKPGSHSFKVRTKGQANAQTYTWTQNALAGSYLIQNSQTRQPLAVPYVASPQGQQLTTQSAPGYLEEWLIRSDGALANPATGMLANVYGNRTAPNTPAIAWQDVNPLPSNMQWTFVDEGSGQYSIVSALNGYVLDVDPNNMANVRLNPREVPSPGQTTSYKWWTLSPM